MEPPYRKMTGRETPDLETEVASVEVISQRINVDANITDETQRGHICRCLGQCGKQLLERRPSKGLCPNCGSYCASATFASKTQAEDLAHKSWTVMNSNLHTDAVRELGLMPMNLEHALESDLRKMARGRNDERQRRHLFAHRHIIGRPGLANGDLKTKASLRKALGCDATVPRFRRTPERTSPGVMGKLIEAELEFRAGRRQMRGLSMRPRTLRYAHPVLGPSRGPVTVEIDGEYRNLPVELKTVSTFEALDHDPRRLRDMIRQLSGQAIASNVDQSILIIAERDGNRMTAMRIGGLRAYHLRNVTRWMAELDVAHQMTEMTRKGVINDVEL